MDAVIVNDKEYYLLKARVLCEAGRYGEALAALDSLGRSPVLLGEGAEIAREAAYYRALARTLHLGASSTEADTQTALEDWFRVKYVYRDQRTHPHFLVANEQIRMLSGRE
jgi:hypothetical protein